ncbi:MAG TPA: hypothetical protein VFW90_01200 [Candidatus Saccharimonadales bacterium]|nr:hypothetical protein [Candidatus Saccharimonadales bacterium]
MYMRTHSLVNRLTISVVACGLCLVVAASVSVARAASSATQPYFKVYGGSVVVGGAFSDKNATGCATNYQYSASGSSATAGGIYAFAKSGSGLGGASTEYDAYATGPVDHNSSDNYGFYTSAITSPGNSDHNLLTFANTATGGVWGGYFDGSVPQSDCIPDYFDNQQSDPQAKSGDISSLNGLSGQYLYKNSGITNINGTLNVDANQNLTLFIDGDVHIGSNITYAGSYSASQVPKFALVVRGNIYVGPSVSQLDGLYIAQPQSPSDTANGVLWTCHDNSTDQSPAATWFASNCASKLTINGAVIARQINLMRLKGDVNAAAATVNEASSSGNIAEVINYDPSMVIGGGFFHSQSAPTYKVDSVISLPPVF